MDMSYSARIFSRYRTMADSALNQVVRYLLKAERDGFSKESLTQFRNTLTYSVILPALYLAVARPAVKQTMRALEGREPDDEDFTKKVFDEGLASLTYSLPFSQFTITPLIQAVRADDPRKAKLIAQRIANEGGILSGASALVELMVDVFDYDARAKAYTEGKKLDGTSMTAAERKQARNVLDRRGKRLVDQLGRTTDEWTGMPIGRIQRIATREREKSLR
jgi:hypothetical protein